MPYNYTGDTEQARLRGVYVHKAIELYNADNLDENSLDPALVPYLESYKKAERLNFDSIVIDYKTGSNHPCTALQLAGYVELARVNRKSLQDNPKHEIQLYHPTYRYAGTIDYVCLTSELEEIAGQTTTRNPAISPNISLCGNY
ncbi:MAG: hypothetical protein DDT31_01563 [Syntrophomonadaceae bacterium]|nr:hypothetical protein [Bacillota bacterium]